jgi:hypothetical protein
MGRTRHRIYLSAVALTGVWATAFLLRAASDFSATYRIDRPVPPGDVPDSPAGKSTTAHGFDRLAYLRRKGIDPDEVMRVAQERTTERRAIARSRALWDVAVAFGPLLALVGLGWYARRGPKAPPATGRAR